MARGNHDSPISGKTYLSGFDPLPADVQARLWPEGVPFFKKTEKSKPAIVVCLHGFGASPYEIRPVAEACAAAGIDAVAPLLPGHGFAAEVDQKQEITRMTKDSAIAAVRQEIARARENHAKVFVYGQSMGGALALIVAGEGIVDAVATTAPAIKLPGGAGFLMGLVALSCNKLNFYIKKQAKPRSFTNLSYAYHNSLAAAQMQRISLHARKMLASIQCPVFVAHSHHDSTIDPVVTTWIQGKARGPVEIAWFDESDHTMPLDVQGQAVSKKIAAFFSKHA
jgi:carboxylesterase